MEQTFDYTKLRFFRKDGVEIPMSIDSDLTLTISNKYGDDAVFYYITSPEGYITSTYRKSSGNRFKKEDFPDSSTEGLFEYSGDYDEDYNDDFNLLVEGNVTGKLKTPKGYRDASVSIDLSNVLSNEHDEYCIESISYTKLEDDEKVFPSVRMNGKITFDLISTMLVETESIYVLVCNDEGKLVTIDEYIHENVECKEWFERFSLLFYIDCREQKNFRFFNVSNEEVVWSDRHFISPNGSDQDSDYRINIGFIGEDEGVYEDRIYICLVDKHSNDDVANIYTIGSILLSAETVGEDERYRTLFTNFGIPNPLEYKDIFRDTDMDEPYTDYEKMNKHMKEMFLSYSEIFPYAGSYKALINALKCVGYDDLFFKEWYMSKDPLNGVVKHIAYDSDYLYPENGTPISKVPIEERISLKKTNWLSMMYRINELDSDAGEDRYGFPKNIKNGTYTTDDAIVKLISLRKWLEKYITGLHCRIIDICGEGVYFERYRMHTYGEYQNIYDYNAEKNLCPYFTNASVSMMKDCSANIEIGVGYGTGTIYELKNVRFSDICIGSIEIENDCKFTRNIPIDTHNSILISEDMSGYGKFESAIAICETYTPSFIFDNERFIDPSCPKIRVYNNKISFVGSDVENIGTANSIFTSLPIIEIKKGEIISNENDTTNSILYNIKQGDEIFILNNIKTGDIEEYNVPITIIPDLESESATLAYTDENVYRLPSLLASGYYISNTEDGGDKEYICDSNCILNIIEGRLIFNFDNYIIDVIYTDPYNTGIAEVYVKVKYISKNIILTEYKDSVDSSTTFFKFFEGDSYSGFVSAYDINETDAVIHNLPININVNYCGTYNGTVLAKDIFNGIYKSRCINTIDVATTNCNTIKYAISDHKMSDSDKEIEFDSPEWEHIKESFVPYPIIGRTYESNTPLLFDEQLNIFSFDDKTPTSIFDSSCLFLCEDNTSDEFEYDERYPIEENYDDEIKCNVVDFVIERKSHRKILYTDYIINEGLSDEDPFAHMSKNPDKTECQIVFYNREGQFAEAQFAAYVVKGSDASAQYLDDEYIVRIPIDKNTPHSWYENNYNIPEELGLVTMVYEDTTYAAGTFDVSSHNYSYIEKIHEYDTVNIPENVGDNTIIDDKTLIKNLLYNKSIVIYLIPSYMIYVDEISYDADSGNTKLHLKSCIKTPTGQIKISFVKKDSDYIGSFVSNVINSKIEENETYITIKGEIPEIQDASLYCTVSDVCESFVRKCDSISSCSRDDMLKRITATPTKTDEDCCFQYDDNFYVKMFRFNPDYARLLWCDTQYSVVDGFLPKIKNNMKLFRCSNGTVGLYNGTIVIVSDTSSNEYDNESSWIWNVYDKSSDSKTLLMSCENEALCLNQLNEYGYSIVLSKFDKFGNEYKSQIEL